MAKFKRGDTVYFYDSRAIVINVEERSAGFPDYFIEMDDSATWAQENELESEEERIKEEAVDA